MNKKLLALAIGAAAAMPFVAEAAGPTLYGKMNVTLDSVETDTGVPATSTDVWALNSNASRLGVKGDAETEITGLTGIYYAEWEIDVDDGATPFKQRNIYAGLKGSFGQLKVGNMDTPLKEAQGKVDQFNDLAGDIKNIMPGETRANNVIFYNTPKLADAITVNLAVMPAENTSVDGEAGNEDGIADAMSASVVFEKDAFYAALAFDTNMTASSFVDSLPTADDRADITRLVAAYKMDAIELGAIYQVAEEVGAAATGEDTAVFLSGAYKTGAWKFKTQYGTGEGDTNGKQKTLMAVGADYALGKSTTVFGYYADVSTDNKAPTVDTAVTTLALGLEQKF